MMRSLAMTLASAALLTATACGDDSTAPIEHNFVYELTVTGDISARLTGQAFFGTDTSDSGEPAFAVLMGSDTSSMMVVLGRQGSARPGTGTYDIAGLEFQAQQWTGMLISSEGEELKALFISNDGQLTITESTSLRLKGTVDFTATGFFTDDVEEPAEIRVAGTFDAKAAPHEISALTGR